MSKEIVLFSSEEKKDLQSVAAFLHQLADKLAQNQVILHKGGEEIKLEISNNVVLELKAKRKPRKE